MRIAPAGSMFTTPLAPRPPVVRPETPASRLPEPVGPQPSRSFGEMVADAGREVTHLQADADRSAEQITTGQAQARHSAMATLNKASLALDLTVQVRNKAIESYQEIMRMQM